MFNYMLSSAVYDYLKSTEFQDLAKALAAVGIDACAVPVTVLTSVKTFATGTLITGSPALIFPLRTLRDCMIYRTA